MSTVEERIKERYDLAETLKVFALRLIYGCGAGGCKIAMPRGSMHHCGPCKCYELPYDLVLIADRLSTHPFANRNAPNATQA